MDTFDLGLPLPVGPAGQGAECATSHESAVSCRGMVRDFDSGSGTVRVLHGVDLEVPRGEMTFLVGPSGCGKTTLISIIAGILKPTAGGVSVLGRDLATLRDAKLVRFRRRHIGFIFQQYNLLPALTAAENAAIPLVAAGRPLDRAARDAAAVLERLGMGPHLQKLPRQLSGGQQQRVAIARAVVHAPQLVVCDEPTAALDAASGAAVMQLLRAVALDAGRAVIVVTHDNRILPFADRIAEMEDGRIIRVRDRREIEESAAWH